jgi:NAD(P)-dependent dehydrogenase (short-subunit alcohol dehydrogenase family)
MDLELTGKRAIVTGGSRGIGLAVARALAAEGSHVALVARDAAVLAAARKAVDAVPSAAGSGRRVIAVGCDTGDDDAVRDMMAAVVDGLGGVDILVNAARQFGGVSGASILVVVLGKAEVTGDPSRFYELWWVAVALCAAAVVVSFGLTPKRQPAEAESTAP